MNFREWHGLKPKARRNCPVCGVESVGGLRCKSHADRRNNRRNWLTRFLAQCVDEARS